MLVAGLDCGSRTIKAALVDGGGAVVATRVAAQEVRPGPAAAALYDALLRERGLDRSAVARVVATGIGAAAVTFADAAVTEIAAQAAGIARLAPGARTVFEVGGQDSKLLRLDDRGTLADFAMNDRCAAGTGRFLEMVAARLTVPVGELGRLAAAAAEPVPLNSTCAVFAETELTGLLLAGKEPAALAAGALAAVAQRVTHLAEGRLDGPVVLTGGVALIDGLAAVVSRWAGHPVAVAPRPQLTGAVGAALLAHA